MAEATAYIPTVEERATTLGRGDFLKLSGDGVFATLQGEGATAGRESVFLRLQGCNLHCGADGIGWDCDTRYTWDTTMPEYWKETTNVPVETVADQIRTSWDDRFGAASVLTPNLVISGGEPLRQQDKIIELLDHLGGWTFEIETNGTIAPSGALDVVQFNCSPKLASSGNSLGIRRRLEALRRITAMPNYWLKFVITETDFDADIAEAVEITDASQASPERVLLMCEGREPEQLERNIVRVQAAAERLGYTATQRMHVFWFGNTRRT